MVALRELGGLAPAPAPQQGQRGAGAPRQQLGGDRVRGGLLADGQEVLQGEVGVAECRGQLATGVVGDGGGQPGLLQELGQTVAQGHRAGQVAPGQSALDQREAEQRAFRTAEQVGDGGITEQAEDR